MKQKILIEIDQTEFQKALDKNIENIMLNKLRSQADVLISEEAKKTIDNRVSKDNVEKIIVKMIHEALGVKSSYDFKASLQKSARAELQIQMSDVLAQAISEQLSNEIQERLGYYVRRTIEQTAEKLLRDIIDKTLKKQIEDSVKEMLADTIFSKIKKANK